MEDGPRGQAGVNVKALAARESRNEQEFAIILHLLMEEGLALQPLFRSKTALFLVHVSNIFLFKVLAV